MRSPCMDCNSRKVGCHTGCNAYTEYRQEVDKINAARKETEWTIGSDNRKTRNIRYKQKKDRKRK